MKCLNCSTEVAEGTAECPLCQRVMASPAAAVPPVPIPSAVSADAAQVQTFETITAPAERKVPASVYMGALLLVAGAAWFFMRPIPGLPVPAGAYEDAESRFAVSPVAQGWAQTSGKEKRGDLVEALLFRKPDGDDPLRASFSVFVRPPLADFNEETKATLEAAAVTSLSAAYEGYQHVLTQDAAVDNLKALRLAGSLRRKVAAAAVAVAISSAAAVEFEYKTTALLVPGAGRAYMLVAVAPAAEVGVLQPLFEAAFSSFRVTERPSAHQQKVNDYARIAAIAGAALIVLMFFFKIARAALS